MSYDPAAFDALLDTFEDDLAQALTDHRLARTFDFPPAGTRPGPPRYYSRGVFS